MRRPSPKPYAMLGAGHLAAAVWKIGSEGAGWRYRFNIFRMSLGGQIGQRFTPADVSSLVTLARVLAAELANDGCIPDSQRRELASLADDLDKLLTTRNSP